MQTLVRTTILTFSLSRTCKLTDHTLGPSKNINWVALVWTLCTGIGFTLVGRLSDIFGRRYFFIASSILATIGCAVASTAKTVNQLIGANVLIGLAAAAQSSFNYVTSELVPVRHRFYALFVIFLLGAPIMGFGPLWTRLFISHTSRGWRWDYYLMIMISKGFFILTRIPKTLQTPSIRCCGSSSITRPSSTTYTDTDRNGKR